MGNRNGSKKPLPYGLPDDITTGDVTIRTRRGESLITQEMRAQGMNLTENMLKELGRRNLGEVKTTELVKMIIQMFGFFLPKPIGGANDTVIDVTNTGVKEMLKQIGMKD